MAVAKPFPTYALPFKQPKGPVGAQPMRGSITAPKQSGAHRERGVPAHSRSGVTQVNKPDYKPKGMGNVKRTKETQVNGPSQGQSDVNSESIGSLMGPAPVSATPASFKSKNAKSKQMPFYGNMSLK